jgi:hypothetical protein
LVGVVVEEEEPTVEPTNVPPGVLVRVVMADAPEMVIVSGRSSVVPGKPVASWRAL